MRKFLLFAILCATCSNAWAHGTSTVQISVGASAGKLSINSGTTIQGLKVFADNSDVFDGLGQSIVPGWAFDSSLNSSTIGLNIVDTMFYWNTTSGINATTTDNLTFRRLFFPTVPDTAVVGQSSITDATTTLWDSATVGQSHHIMRYEVPSGSGPGAYGVLVQLQDISAVPSLAASDPFLLIFNKGLTSTPGTVAGQPLDSSQFGTAVGAITAAAVPEPAGACLAIIALGGFVCAARRLKRSPSKF